MVGRYGMNRDALSPAEMARSGTMSEAARRRHMMMGAATGGTIVEGYSYGGGVSGKRRKTTRKKKKNTHRMNELEQLGRIDSYKGKSKKGKENLKAEKKRVIREIKKNKRRT
jgi:hypothetical protein